LENDGVAAQELLVLVIQKTELMNRLKANVTDLNFIFFSKMQPP